MDKNSILEAGKIVNTHGIRGEVKIMPWADSPEFLTDFDRFIIDGEAVAVENARVHKGAVIAKLKGTDDINAAELLRNKTVFILREDAPLPDDKVFIADLQGLEAKDAETGEILGKVTSVLTLPGGDILEIKGAREILVPLRPEFVSDIDIDGKTLNIHLIEGM